MKKTLSITLAASLLAASAAVPAVASAATNYSDVPEGAWYENYLQKLTDMGGINGYEDGTFRPDGTVTVAEFVKAIVSLTSGEKEYKEGEKWYQGYMEYAGKWQLLPSDALVPNKEAPISRAVMSFVTYKIAERQLLEEMPVQMLRYWSSYPDAVEASKQITDFDDFEKTDDETYVKGAVLNCYLTGVITGYDDGSFKPRGSMSRAEMCAVLVRLLDKSERLPADVSATPVPNVDVSDLYSQQGFWLSEGNITAENLVKFSSVDNLVKLGFYRMNADGTWSPTFSYLGQVDYENAYWYDDGSYSYKAQIARPNMKLYETDPDRPAAIEGDTFVTADGTEYLLTGTDFVVQDTTAYDGTYRFIGVGLPIATELGRRDAYGRVVTNHSQPVIGYERDTTKAIDLGYDYKGPRVPHWSGGLTNGALLTDDEYHIYDWGSHANHEGHAKSVWEIIERCNKPSYRGEYDGQFDESGYFVWIDMAGWKFAPYINPEVATLWY